MAVDVGVRRGRTTRQPGSRRSPSPGYLSRVAAGPRLAGHRRVAWFDAVVLLALAWMLLPAALSVREAAWADHLEPMPGLALAGALLGYVYARSRLPGFLAHPLALLVGGETIVLTYSSIARGSDLEGRAQWLVGRVVDWVNVVAGGGASTDLLMFALGMGALAWVLGYLSAWLVFRDRSPWLAAALCAIGLLVNLSYASPSLGGYVGWFVAGALVLVVAEQVGERLQGWRLARVPVERRLWVRILASAGIGVSLLVLIAQALPSGAVQPAIGDQWDRVTAPWQNMEQDFDRFFASIKGSPAASRGLSFGRTLAPRGSFDLPDSPVLLVRSPERLYWRATTTDRYTGQAMVGSDVSTAHLDAKAALQGEEQTAAQRDQVSITFKLLATRSVVAFTPDAPLSFDVPVEVDQRAPGDLATIRPSQPLALDQVYTVTASISRASEQELRTSSTEYPSWVRQRYLQLPRSLPTRVQDIAAQVTQGADTPYDKAAAIESYFRNNFTYSTHVPEVPPDRDWVDYFLFDSKQGYCDYFATSMVVLLRSQGVPARVASGFAPGEFDPNQGAWLVRENQAHSWVEAYFPGYGWITFEPSAIRTLPERFQSVPQDQGAAATDTQGDPGLGRPVLTPEEQDELRDLSGEGARTGAGGLLTGPARVVAGIVVGLLLLALVAAAVAAIVWRRGLGGLAWYQRPYVQLVRLGAWLGGRRPSGGSTPYEMADLLARDVPVAAPTIRELAEAYVEGTYAGRAPSGNPTGSWLGVRWQVARALLGRRLRASIPRLRPED